MAPAAALAALVTGRWWGARPPGPADVPGTSATPTTRLTALTDETIRLYAGTGYDVALRGVEDLSLSALGHQWRRVPGG